MIYGVTTENREMLGFTIVAEGATLQEVEREGGRAAWNDTTRCNLRVGSASALRRRLRIPARRWEMMLEAWDNNQASSDAHSECARLHAIDRENGLLSQCDCDCEVCHE